MPGQSPGDAVDELPQTATVERDPSAPQPARGREVAHLLSTAPPHWAAPRKEPVSRCEEQGAFITTPARGAVRHLARLVHRNEVACDARGLLDHREQPHESLAEGTAEDVHGEGARQELRPRAVSGLPRSPLSRLLCDRNGGAFAGLSTLSP